MEGEPTMEDIHSKIKGYVDFVYRDYTSRYSYQENILRRYSDELYHEWFTGDFVQELLNNHEYPDGYDICSMFSTDHFFENNDLVNKVNQSLFEYFENYDGSLSMLNLMRTYTAVYVTKNIDIFIEKYRTQLQERDNDSNERSDNTPDNDSLHDDDIPELIENEDDDDDDIDDEDSGFGIEILDCESLVLGSRETSECFARFNTETECPVCMDVTMNCDNSIKFVNCTHFVCEPCHDNMFISLNYKVKNFKCPICREPSYYIRRDNEL
jgi:hypothetical protein